MKTTPLALAALTTAALVSAPGTATAAPVRAVGFAAPCLDTVPTGRIGRRWTASGGSGGVFGCPTSRPRAVSGGVRQSFRNGQIAWSPGQGPDLTVRAYLSQGRVYFKWTTTAPFSYDFFLVRWSFGTGGIIPTNRQYTYRGPSRSEGAVSVRVPAADSVGSDGSAFDVTLIVEGCDEGGFLSSSRCRQGWTVPLDLRA